MGQAALNLTRKWRSKKFKEIIGQDLVVKILQNSLYKNTFFPVYLFSGQRGCGKTTTARVFAAALNCEKISDFQKDPKNNQIPCTECESCVAMMQMRHPDFVEIDAASYTGVDNIRNIIDTSSFLPVLSKHKVYLIDEVHMLSKSAFNAFLKILEEPPPFVVFVLATTEIQKLPETVKSRCFQLFFNPVKFATITKHLQAICENESIVCDIEALEIISQASEGSLRDAINVLEQSRFASDKVSKEVVCSVLGYLDDQFVADIMCAVLQKNHKKLLEHIDVLGQKAISVDYLLKKFQEFLYDVIMLKYSTKPKYFLQVSDSLKDTVASFDMQHVMNSFEQLSLLDEVLAKTSKKQLVLESKLIAMVLVTHSDMNVEKKKLKTDKDSGNDQQQWDTFIQALANNVDPILYSMFCESDFISFNQEKKAVQIKTLKKFTMFQDLFVEYKKNYQSLLERCFGSQALLFVDFSKIAEQKKVVEREERKPTLSSRQTARVVHNVAGKLDISDKEKWELTHILLKHFGGTVSEMVKDTHESDA